MIKAVIFDCFGVLTTDGWKQIREEYLSSDESFLNRSFQIDKAVNAGTMTYTDFVAEISDMTGLSIADVRTRLNGSAPNIAIFDHIRDNLKQSYKIGMLSNAADNWLDDLFEPWQVALFDATALSYEIGAVKPERVMYTTIVDRLAVLPDESVFIDDSEQYCVAARALGIQAIHHTDTQQTLKQLQEILRA